MIEGQLGHASIFRTGNLIANLLLNFFHLAVWFAVLWLLLEFRWGHAFGLALVFWTVVMLFLLPPVLVERLEHYFSTYKMVPGQPNKMSITGKYGFEHAKAVIEAASADYQDAFGEATQERRRT